MRIPPAVPKLPVVELVDAAANPWLRGAFAPVRDELDTNDLAVEGRLPGELVGSYVRNGPNPQFTPLGSYTFPFDGDGMVHMVTFEGGRARYRNRWVVTRGLAAERRAGRALYGGTFTPIAPDPARLGADGDPNPFKTWANMHVVRHRGRVLALSDGGTPYELTAELATVGERDYDGLLPGGMSSHPKLDPIWDELCFFHTDVVPPYLVFGVVGPKGRVTRTEPIDLAEPALIHDFVVTDQHVVFFDSPAVFDAQALLRGEAAVRWNGQRGTRIGVMSRESDAVDLRWIPVEDCFAMHFLNGYTDGDTVVVDYVHRRRLDVPGGMDDNVPRLHRAVIDLDRRTVRDELVDSRAVELPRIDDRRTGLRHKVGYVAAASDPAATRTAMYDTIVRYDVDAGSATEHRFTPGVVVGEPVFAPRPGGLAEDDGWVLVFTYDTNHDRSDLVVLDASRVSAPPVAVVHLPRRIPVGMHGSWLAAGE
jgi:carotenoid cleavage dioxygenase-like enzyme